MKLIFFGGRSFNSYFLIHPFAARSSAATSILSISIIADITRSAFALSLSASISPRRRGPTCHDNPNLSLKEDQFHPRNPRLSFSGFLIQCAFQ
jgi:hypothetical protein